MSGTDPVNRQKDCTAITPGYRGVTSISGSTYTAWGAVDQQACPRGTFDDSGDGVGDCVDITPGYRGVSTIGGSTYTATGAVDQEACPQGTYNDGSTQCKECPAGRITA